MKQGLIFIALTLAVTMTLVHFFIGGRLIARPLLESDLETLARMTLYLCWHGITIVLAGMALLYADALFWRKDPNSARLASGLAAAFFFLIWFVIAAFGLGPLQLPQWIVFAPMAVFGALGVKHANRA
ncbi:hypothetical protein PUV54_06840 [Hyphococcus flavus]|uniref:Uncharacterized protein n=1 Tax=Hyphococcus flavus TaxID=1866326 RepID=A0AAE9ZH23_9PROT|nr:hypothetical protein [Hyphococcus flavus]WDI32913.1 hypothetical protein PUV54_06840 [Hyphococcus flavus]